MLTTKTLTKEQVYQKLKHYCAYQDRSYGEAKTKAYLLGMKKPVVEELIAGLIEEGCLNEERFAKAFAGGKFRMKQWGKIKIRAELKQSQVSEYCIAAALNEIDFSNYKKTLQKLAVKRWNSIKGSGTNLFVKMTKTRDYLLGKGYEPGLIANEIRALVEKQKGAG
ncbi:MAG TPA: regulatory protein RecX [Chitinophagaceae bacterium]|nr:regulatory protein RecX [Chitinophagaceae bacterium]